MKYEDYLKSIYYNVDHPASFGAWRSDIMLFGKKENSSLSHVENSDVG